MKVRKTSPLIKVTGPSKRKNMRVKILKKEQSKLQSSMKNTVGVTAIIAVMQPVTESQSSIGIKQPLGIYTSYTGTKSERLNIRRVTIF